MKTSQLKSYFRSGSDSNGLAFFNKWYYFVNFIRKTKRQRLVTNDKEIADDILKNAFQTQWKMKESANSVILSR